MTKELTDQERKILRYEKRLGYAFCAMILIMGGLINLFYFALYKGEYNRLVGVIDSCIPLIAVLVCWLLNRDVNRDLKENFKDIQAKKIDKLITEPYYQIGDLRLQHLGWSFFYRKKWKKEVPPEWRYFVLSGENRYMIERDLYDSLKDAENFYLHQAKHSETILGFSKDV